MFQDISSNQIMMQDAQLDEKIRRVAAGLRRLSCSPSEYSVRVLYEAYEITGIWIDAVLVYFSTVPDPVYVFSRGSQEGIVQFRTSSLEFLSRDDSRSIARLLSDVQYEPALPVAPWYEAQMDLAIH